MAMAGLGANWGPRRPSRFTALGLDCLVLKMGAIISCEASVINDRWKGPQSHKIGGFHDVEKSVYGYYTVWSGSPNFF
jgi:hypothetical protein